LTQQGISKTSTGVAFIMDNLSLNQLFEDGQVILLVTVGMDYNRMVLENVKDLSGKSVCYVSLNKTQKSTEYILKNNKIKTDKLFFIDCVTNEKSKDDVLHISPDNLDLLSAAINDFIIYA